MTLAQIAKEIARYFEVPMDKMISGDKGIIYTRPRYVWRVIAFSDFKYSQVDIAKFELTQQGIQYSKESSKCRSAINTSIKKVVHDGMWGMEYESALRHIRKLFPAPVISHEEVRMTDDGITRVTQEEFDSRFYGHADKINPKTGTHWFPSWHYLHSNGAPQEEFLTTYHKSKGFFSDFEFHRAMVMGSYVHNRIEDMGEYGIDTTHEQIHRSFPNPKEARRVEECLLSWINFVKNEEPIVVSYEQKVIAEDWGGTVDLRAKIKSDNYKDVWTIDFKTSKTVYDSHMSQVECYRRQFGDGKAAVLVLGKSTKNRYTLTEVKEKDRDFFYNDFILLKEVAYHRLRRKNRLQPHEKDMPDIFTLKGLNIKKL